MQIAKQQRQQHIVRNDWMTNNKQHFPHRQNERKSFQAAKCFPFFFPYTSELDSNWRKCVLAFYYVRKNVVMSATLTFPHSVYMQWILSQFRRKVIHKKTDTTTAAIATGDHVDLIFHLLCTRTFVQSVSLFWFDQRENHLWNWDEEKARALSRKVNVCIHIHRPRTRAWDVEKES